MRACVRFSFQPAIARVCQRLVSATVHMLADASHEMMRARSTETMENPSARTQNGHRAMSPSVPRAAEEDARFEGGAKLSGEKTEQLQTQENVAIHSTERMLSRNPLNREKGGALGARMNARMCIPHCPRSR